MRRLFAVTLLIVLTLALTACDATSPPSVGTPGKTSRSINPGTAVELDNGLTVTIPASWTATLTTYPEPSGDLKTTQYLLIENWNADSGPNTLMVLSSATATVSVEALNEYGRDSFSSVPLDAPVQYFVGRSGTPFEPKHLMTAVTHVPGASTGILFYAGDPEDPQGALDTVSKLFSIKGL